MNHNPAIRSKLWFFALIFFCLAPFLPFFLSSTQVLLYRDLAQTDLPAKALWLRSILSEGFLPRWNYLSGAGYPFLADLVSAPFHPFNFVFILFGESNLPRALTFFVLLHYPFLFWGSYRLFRELRFSRPLAACGALAITWSGFALSAHNLTHILAGITVAPWFAYAWIKVLKLNRFKDYFFASLFLAMPIFGGDPQFSILFGALAFAGAICGKDRLLNFRSFGIVALLALLLSAAQLLPALELLEASSRTVGGGDSSTWALSSARLIELLLPNYLGSYTNPVEFAGREFTGKSAPAFFINSVYLGILPLFCLVWAVTSGWAARRFRHKKILWVWVGLTAILLALAMGKWFPLDIYGWLASWNPLWRGFRNPERLFFYVGMSLLVSSFFCLKACLHSLRIFPKKIRQSLFPPTAILLFILVACFALNYRTPESASAFRHSLFCLLLIPAIFHLRLRVTSIAQGYFLVFLLIAFDLSYSFDRNLVFQPKSLAEKAAYPLTVLIDEDVGKRASEIAAGAPDRFISLQPAKDQWWDQALTLSGFDPLDYGELTNWEGLIGNTGTYFSLADANGHHSLRLQGPTRIFSALWESHQTLATNLLGARYVLSRPANVEQPNLKINESALPNFFVAQKVEYSASLEQLIEAMKDMASAKAAAHLEGSSRETKFQPLALSKTKKTSREFELKIEAKDGVGGEVIVWNEAHYPAWRVYFDGTEIPMLRANGWAMAARLPEAASGPHVIAFRFDETKIRLGQTLSFIWIAAYLAVLILRRGGRRPRTQRN